MQLMGFYAVSCRAISNVCNAHLCPVSFQPAPQLQSCKTPVSRFGRWSLPTAPSAQAASQSFPLSPLFHICLATGETPIIVAPPVPLLVVHEINMGMFGRTPKPALARAYQTVHCGASPVKESHLEPLPVSIGEVEPRNMAPSGSVSRHQY